MKFKRSFKIALNIIFHSKVRSWLTILGIVIGIAAIVAIVSIGQGAQQALAQSLNSLNANIITVSPGFSRAAGAGAGFRGGFGGGQDFGGFGNARSGSSQKNLTARDVLLLNSISNVEVATGYISGGVDKVTYLGKTARVNIEGIDPAVMKDIVTTDLSTGRYLVKGDSGSVVIGGRIANSTFSNIDINRMIVIGGKNFRIVGILQQSGGNDDAKIYMPIESAVTIIDGKVKDNYDSVLVKIKDITLTDDTVTKITNTLMASHTILANKNPDFTVTSLKSVQQRVTSTLSSQSLFLSAIAAISLIVGAIGIMNTMFTSVLEKTREIGVLKALGAKNTDILTIFLLNSGIIGFIGGVFGVLLGVLSSGYVASISGVSLGGGGRMGLATAYVSPQLIIGVFTISILVGLISGAIPAYRASRLRPIEALRSE